MRKLLLLTLVMFLGGLILVNGRVSAMMHLGTPSAVSETLSDEEYEQLGEAWMEQMMGTSHEAMDEEMREMMGEEFLRQMHIAMGKRLQSPGSFGMMPMMGMMGMMGTGAFGNMMTSPWGTPVGLGWQTSWLGSSLYPLVGSITWIALIAFLVAATRWFWRKGGK